MGLSLSNNVGLYNGSLVGSRTDLLNVSRVLRQIGFNHSQALFELNNTSPQRRLISWCNLIGDFQIQFIQGRRSRGGLRGLLNERDNVLSMSSPNFRIERNGQTHQIINELLDATLLVSVSLNNQTASIYEGGVHMRTYPITSGAIGTNTPVGLFHINWSRPRVRTRRQAENYRSRNGRGASMPFPVFFTDKGHALHTGTMRNTNVRAGSHGCVRQPSYYDENSCSLNNSNYYSRMLWETVNYIESISTRNTSIPFLPNSFVFIFDRPEMNHGSRRGDIPRAIFNTQETIPDEGMF